MNLKFTWYDRYDQQLEQVKPRDAGAKLLQGPSFQADPELRMRPTAFEKYK